MRKDGKREQNHVPFFRSARPVWIVVIVLAVAFIFGIIAAIASPYVRAFRVLRDTSDVLMHADPAVTLCDPYVIVEIMPEVVEKVPDHETAEELLVLLRAAMKNAAFEGRKQILGGISDPYICVSGEETVIVYLSEDSFQIEKNSTFYRFSPKNSEEKTAYAEFYDRVMQLLTPEI